MKQLMSQIKQRLEYRGLNQFKFNRYGYNNTAFRVVIGDDSIRIIYPYNRTATKSTINLNPDSKVDDVEQLIFKHYQIYRKRSFI